MGMKKTFELLERIELGKLKKMESADSSEVQQFLNQLKSDFYRDISKKFTGFDAIQLAEHCLIQILEVDKKNGNLINQEAINKLDEISRLLNDTGEHAQRIIEVVQAMSTICSKEPEEKKTLHIKLTLSCYRTHLLQKCKKQGININSDGNIVLLSEDKIIPSIKQKLINRYQAINNAYNKIKDKDSISSDENKELKQEIKKCVENKPDWSERPFIQKLTDVLSLGITSYCRSMFSKEKAYTENLVGKNHEALQRPSL